MAAVERVTRPDMMVVLLGLSAKKLLLREHQTACCCCCRCCFGEAWKLAAERLPMMLNIQAAPTAVGVGFVARTTR